MYKLTVTKQEENPNYTEEVKLYKQSRNGFYGGQSDLTHPQKVFESSKLEVELTDEEYEAIKQAVLSTFK